MLWIAACVVAGLMVKIDNLRLDTGSGMSDITMSDKWMVFDPQIAVEVSLLMGNGSLVGSDFLESAVTEVKRIRAVIGQTRCELVNYEAHEIPKGINLRWVTLKAHHSCTVPSYGTPIPLTLHLRSGPTSWIRTYVAQDIVPLASFSNSKPAMKLAGYLYRTQHALTSFKPHAIPDEVDRALPDETQEIREIVASEWQAWLANEL